MQGSWLHLRPVHSAHLHCVYPGRGWPAHLLPSCRCACRDKSTCEATAQSPRFRRSAQVQGAACEHASMRRARSERTAQRRAWLPKPLTELHAARSGAGLRQARSPGRAAPAFSGPDPHLSQSFRANENRRVHRQVHQHPVQHHVAPRVWNIFEVPTFKGKLV